MLTGPSCRIKGFVKNSLLEFVFLSPESELKPQVGLDVTGIYKMFPDSKINNQINFILGSYLFQTIILIFWVSMLVLRGCNFVSRWSPR